MVEKDSFRQDVSQLLVASRDGKQGAQDALFERVYAELRQRARWERRRWQENATLNTTALVNEAYLKLVGREDQSWDNRSHFFAVAAKAMRHILINYARHKSRKKRGGNAPKLSLEQLQESLGREVAVTEEAAEVLTVLDEALDQLAEEHPRAARGVECRFFGGMTIEETAEALGVSTATVSRDWFVAQGWLYREMKRLLEGHLPGGKPIGS